MHALFALEDRSLEFINTLFAPIFLDFVRLIEQYWESLVQAIYDGRVPDFEGVEGTKHYLQVHTYRPYKLKVVLLTRRVIRLISSPTLNAPQN